MEYTWLKTTINFPIDAFQVFSLKPLVQDLQTKLQEAFQVLQLKLLRMVEDSLLEELEQTIQSFLQDYYHNC